MQFQELNLIAPVLRALDDQNYDRPTPIQEKAIPLILNGTDVLGCAQTGTGKTAAFALPIIQHLCTRNSGSPRVRKIRSLVLTPTRELALQIGESFTSYSRYTNIKNTVIFGGVKQGSQTNALQNGVDVLVATPGRLLDLMDQGYVHLNNIEYFVLDEADRMLDMGFIHDIRKIIARLPAKRQSLFFSATMPPSIVDLSQKILHKPAKVSVSPKATAAETVQQYVYFTNKSTKKDLLTHILANHEIEQALLFSRTKHGADKIARNLKRQNIKAAAIHGDKAQNQRQKALDQFKNGGVRVLVATDIAARGIDIDKLRYVINYDIPNVAETYVHRIGRSGRAGEEGISISMCEPEENNYLRDIEKLMSRKIQPVKSNPFPQTDKPMTTQEKKEWEQEKKKRKQEYFAARAQKKNKGESKRSRSGKR